MDANRFDAISRSLANRFSRRGAVKTIGAAGLASIPIVATQRSVTVAQDATPMAVGSPEAETSSSFLFTQVFTSGTAEAATDVTGVYRLTLVQNPRQTLFFAERPSRYAGMVDTEKFFNWLTFDPNNPPNAALVTQTADDEEFIAVVQLTNPQLVDDSTISYDVNLLDDYTGEKLSYFAENADNGELPSSFESVTLFIDSQDSCAEDGDLCGFEVGCCKGLSCQFDGRFGICR